MKHRFLHCIVVNVAVLFAAYAMVSDVNAQAPPKPTPHLADGRPDLNGTGRRHCRTVPFACSVVHLRRPPLRHAVVTTHRPALAGAAVMLLRHPARPQPEIFRSTNRSS